MFKKTTRIAFATLVVGMFSFSANAEPVHGCGVGCSNVDYKANQISINYDQGDLFTIIDFSTDTAHTYRADKYFRFGEMFDRAIKVRTSSRGSAIVNKIKDVRLAAKNIVINVPSDLPNTANSDQYGSSSVLITNPQSRDHIAAWLKTNADLQAQIGTLLGDLVSDIGGAINVKLDVRVRVSFADGSTGDFSGVNEVVNGYLTRSYDFIPDSARFKDGSRLPRSVANVLGNWAFTYEGDADGFIRLGSLWGVKFRESIQCTPTAEFKCTTDSKGEMVCTTIQKCE